MSQTQERMLFLNPGPESLADAIGRGALRLEQNWDADPVPPCNIPGYEECVGRYEKLALYHADAEARLLATLGISDAAIRANKPEKSTSWRLQNDLYSTPEGQREVPLVHKITTSTSRGHLGGINRGDTILESQTYLLLTPTHEVNGGLHFTGELTGHIAFKEDTPPVARITGSQLLLRPFSDITHEVNGGLRVDARRAVLDKWADAFFAASESDYVPITASELFGEKDERAAAARTLVVNSMLSDQAATAYSAFSRIFTHKPQTREEAMELLDGLFQPQSNAVGAMKVILTKSAPGLKAALQELGATERFDWFTRNIATLHKEINQASQQAIAFGFAEGCNGLLAAEEEKLTLLEYLIVSIERTRDVSDSAPLSK